MGWRDGSNSTVTIAVAAAVAAVVSAIVVAIGVVGIVLVDRNSDEPHKTVVALPAGYQSAQAQQPGVPVIPGVPGAPVVPGVPGIAGVPGAPALPGAPAVPGQAGSNLGLPGQPGGIPLPNNGLQSGQMNPNVIQVVPGSGVPGGVAAVPGATNGKGGPVAVPPNAAALPPGYPGAVPGPAIAQPIPVPPGGFVQPKPGPVTPTALSEQDLIGKMKLLLTGPPQIKPNELEAGQAGMPTVDAVSAALKTAGPIYTWTIVGPVNLSGSVLNAQLKTSLGGIGDRLTPMSWKWIDGQWKLSNESLCALAAQALAKCSV